MNWAAKVRKKMEMYKKPLFFLLQNTPQAPERRLVKVLCMSGLLNFLSHDVIGLAVTENEDLSIMDEFAATVF